MNMREKSPKQGSEPETLNPEPKAAGASILEGRAPGSTAAEAFSMRLRRQMGSPLNSDPPL